MKLTLFIEFLVPVIAIIAAIKGFNVAKSHSFKRSIRLFSYGLVLIALSYIVPFSSLLAIKTELYNYQTLGTFNDVAYLLSAIFTVIGYILITIAIFNFRES